MYKSNSIYVCNSEVPNLVSKVVHWFRDRNMIDGCDNISQFHKLIQESAELSDNLMKGKDRRDDYGDIMVVLIGMMERDGLTMQECLHKAYLDIKDRKGTMQNGVFIKETDDVCK